MKKKSEDPQLGLIDPSKPTVVIDLEFTPDVKKFINKVSKLSNHTISSVITVLLSVQCITFGPIANKKQEGKAWDLIAPRKLTVSTAKKGKKSSAK